MKTKFLNVLVVSFNQRSMLLSREENSNQLAYLPSEEPTMANRQIRIKTEASSCVANFRVDPQSQPSGLIAETHLGQYRGWGSYIIHHIKPQSRNKLVELPLVRIFLCTVRRYSQILVNTPINNKLFTHNTWF